MTSNRDTGVSPSSNTVLPSSAEQESSSRGLLMAIVSQVIWGLFPIFWKLMTGVSPLYSLGARMVWGGVFMIILCSLVKHVNFTYLLHDKKAVAIFFSSSVFTATNWGIYIWSVSSEHILEASIGYFLLPLLTIIMGVIVFKERMTKIQIGACLLALFGICCFIYINGGDIWISLSIALTFGLYAAIKKKGNYPALPGMTLESLFSGILGLGILVIGFAFPAFWDLVPATPHEWAVFNPWMIFVLSIIAGIITAFPLLLYSDAANHITLVTLGFIQYLAPTIEICVAILVFGESFTLAHALCLGSIWLGLACITSESFVSARRLRICASKK